MARMLTAGVMLCASSVLAAPATVYVAPDGDDAQAGSAAQPFATLARARQAVRELKQRGLPDGGVTVVVRGGVYRLTETLALTGEDGGTAEAPVVWRSAPGETVRLMGGARLTGFAPVTDPAVRERLAPEARDQVRQVDLTAAGVTRFGVPVPGSAATAQLYCNQRHLPLARYPNQGWLRIADVPQTGEEQHRGMYRGPNPVIRDGIPAGKHYGRFVYDGDRPSRWRAAPDIWLLGYWVVDYREAYARVARIDADQRAVWPAKPYPYYGLHKGDRYCFLNVLEELDSPGEWYLDRQSGRLYLWAPEDLAQAEVTFPDLDQPLVSLIGAEHVQVRGLTIECGRREGVVVRGGHHVEVAGCVLRNLGGTAVSVDGSHNGVRSCDVYQVGATGIDLAGGDRKTLSPAGNYAVNCHLHHFAQVQKTYQPGIRLSGVGQRVAQCSFHDCPHSAIIYGGNDHLVEYCEFTRIGLETGDVGTIYTAMDWTNLGLEFRYNYFHHIGPPEGVQVGSMTIYLDLPCGGAHVHHNIFHDMPRAFFSDSGRGSLIEHNLFIDCRPSIYFYVWRDPQYFRPKGPWPMVENLLAVNYDQPPYSTRYPVLKRLAEDFAMGEEHILERQLPKDNLVRRNVSYGGQFLVMDPLVDLDDVRVEHNLIADRKVFQGSFTGDGRNQGYQLDDPAAAEALEPRGNVLWSGDPGFVDLSAGDYTLQPDSPAWRLGIEPVPVDQMGLRRDEYRTALPVLEPILSPPGRMFVDALTVTVKSPKRGPAALIRYTLDGSEPTAASPVYEGALRLTESAKVRAAAFPVDAGGLGRSGVVEASYQVRRLGPGGGVWLSELPALEEFAHAGLKQDRNYAGGRIVLAGQAYERGILLCPAATLPDYRGGIGRVTYALDGGLDRAKWLKAVIGIEDAMLKQANASVTFAVEVRRQGRWERVFESDVLRAGASRAIDLDIAGADHLKLITTDAGDTIHCDHAVWADARLE